MQAIVAVCYQVCASLNGSLSVEQLHESIEPRHLSPATVDSSMTAFQEPGEREKEEEMEEDKAGWHNHSKRRDCTAGEWRLTCSLHYNDQLEGCFWKVTCSVETKFTLLFTQKCTKCCSFHARPLVAVYFVWRNNTHYDSQIHGQGWLQP